MYLKNHFYLSSSSPLGYKLQQFSSTGFKNKYSLIKLFLYIYLFITIIVLLVLLWTIHFSKAFFMCVYVCLYVHM